VIGFTDEGFTTALYRKQSNATGCQTSSHCYSQVIEVITSEKYRQNDDYMNFNTQSTAALY